MFTHSKIDCHVEECKKTFTDPSTLRKHIYTIHKNPNFKCDICNEEFQYNDFYIHLKMHEKAKLKCDICQKEFAMRNYLKRHMKMSKRRIFNVIFV